MHCLICFYCKNIVLCRTGYQWREFMKDVQKEKPNYNIPIEQVGVKKLSYPITITRKSNDVQHTIADIKLSVSLPENFKGTHMSRFISLVERYKHNLDSDSAKNILRDMIKIFDCEEACVEFLFPFFIEKKAPVSEISSLMKTTCGFRNSISNGKIKTTLIVQIDATSLCPCSREISDRGAHNQRCRIKVELEVKDFIWFEDVISLLEKSASAPIFALLKRPDEKYVTELAFDHPMFVEDLTREVFMRLKENHSKKILQVKIEVESKESIHQHNAFAIISRRFE